MGNIAHTFQHSSGILIYVFFFFRDVLKFEIEFYTLLSTSKIIHV